MKTITRWFKGQALHVGTRNPWNEPGDGPTECLALACENEQEETRLDKIVARLFPERICDCSAATSRLVDFNNHDATTRDEIDKIMHTYDLEYGA